MLYLVDALHICRGEEYSLIQAIWPCAALSGRVFALFGPKTGIHFVHFSLESGMIFDGVYEYTYHFNSK